MSVIDATPHSVTVSVVAGDARSVIVVEQRAHESAGHFPVRAPQLAAAYAELGFRVELLTSVGWSRDPEHPTPPFTVHRWRSATRWLRARVQHPWARTVLELIEIRARARAMVPSPELVVLLAWDEMPSLVAAMAPRRARVLINEFSNPYGIFRSRVFNPVARVREWQRRRVGGVVRIVAPHEARRASWDEVASYLDPVVAPIAGVREIEPPAAARERLELPASGKLALLFGEPILKRREIVLDAFAQLDDWTLVVGGAVADGLAAGPRLRTFPGVVDDETRDLLFAAVDLVVLSFYPGNPNNSGTLMDAISMGVPVVCPDDAAVAEAIVARYRLGARYANDGADSLASAVRTAPLTVDPDDLERARRELSSRAVARNQLVLMGLTPPTS